MASSLLLSLLLLRGVGAWLDNRTTASDCGSEYITVVVASSSSLRAAARSGRTIAGCYVRNNYFVSQDRPVYTKTTGGTTYGVLGSQVSTGFTAIDPCRGWKRLCLLCAAGTCFCSALRSSTERLNTISKTAMSLRIIYEHILVLL